MKKLKIIDNFKFEVIQIFQLNSLHL